jgi:N-methylhydantoinase A/acetophenone carboxylase
MNSVDIDIGGTFTDCSVQFEGRRTEVKSLTTGFDLSVGFLMALEEAAAKLEFGLEELMQGTNVIRYSTTLAMNKLLERRGPKIGLITTEGFEDLILIGRGAQWDDGLSRPESRNLALVAKPEPLVPRERIVGLKERVDNQGRVLRPLDEDHAREMLNQLVDEAVRSIVVSLLWAHRNPVHELAVRRLIEEEYPVFCLGHLPVVLASEIQPRKGEYQRTVTAVLNTYLHPPMAEDLAGIRRELRCMGYQGPILMVHNSGGMAEITKTRAIDTFNGGPIAGLAGSLEIARLYDFENVITTDMGGTSFDIGLISEGQSQFYETRPLIGQWMVGTPMIEAKSIGAGGGSIARVDRALGNKLSIGPQSAAAMPGPACYNLGGTEPTVTDADVVLGYINPECFHGGRMEIDPDLAREAVRVGVAEPLDLTVEEAAAGIRKMVDSTMGHTIFKETGLRGYDPREFILFSFGGAGPTHCCNYAQAGQVPRLMAFPFSPVFCAFAGSLMDIRHIFEQSNRATVLKPGRDEVVLDFDLFNRTVERLNHLAVDTARSEGLDPDGLMFILELDMKYSNQLHVKRIRSPRPRLESEDHVREMVEAFGQAYARSYGPAGAYPEGGISIENFLLHATYPFKRYEFRTYPVFPSNPPYASRKGFRNVYWTDLGRYVKTPIYSLTHLRGGNIVEGPAVIEADATTLVLPGFSRLHIDRYMNFIIDLIP